MQLLEDIPHWGVKRRVLLVQLPPSFSFDDRCVRRFFHALRQEYNGDVVCEPRHASWFHWQADSVLQARPGGWSGIVYNRRHGSPRMHYFSRSPGNSNP